MRKTLETKLENASTALEEQKKEQMKKLLENKEIMETKKCQALALKKELEDGLEKWSQQVLEVQENNMKRAEEQVDTKYKLRRQRSREERRGREQRVNEKRKESKEREEEDMEMKRKAIETKQIKVESLIREREKSIERQRRLAAKTARLRRTIRSQSCSNYISRGTIEATIQKI